MAHGVVGIEDSSPGIRGDLGGINNQCIFSA